MHSWDEAAKRMKRRNVKSVRWTLVGKTIEYRYVPATAARNYDGSSAGGGQDPDRIILQQMIWREGAAPHYSNRW